MKQIFFIFITVMLFSCSQENPPPSASHHTNRLTVAIAQDPRSFDPLIGVDAHSSFLIKMTGEGLYRQGPNNKLVPGIATHHTISPDGKTYTFYLRESCWSNGELLTAYDFENSWKRGADSKFGDGGFYFYSIKNMERAHLGDVGINEVGIHAIDPYTLVVHLKHPVPAFPEMTATTTYYPIHPSVGSHSPVTNGPFVVKKWDLTNELLLTKNPDYWDQKVVQLEEIRTLIIPDTHTQALLFEIGETDWFGSPFTYLPIHMFEKLDAKYGLHSNPSSEVSWLFVNTEKPPFDNMKMRQAFSYAADRSKIANTIFKRIARTAMSALPTSMSLQPKPYFEDGNIACAKQLFQEALEEMGLSCPSQLPTITISCADQELKYQLAQALQQQWQEAFDVTVQVQREEWKVFFERLNQGDYQLGNISWVSYINDPIWFLQVFSGVDGSMNRTRWKNKQYQELLNTSLNLSNPTERQGMLREAEHLLLEEMPVIPLFHIQGVYLKNNALKGVVYTNLGQIDFKWAHLNQRALPNKRAIEESVY